MRRAGMREKILQRILTMPQSSLQEILKGKEERAERQQKIMQAEPQGTLICFTLNIAGAVKNAPLFEKAFEELGLEYFSDGANFVMVKVADAPKKFVEMQKRGVIVRPNVGYGLPDWLRITIGKPEQNERCIEELSRLVK